MTKGDFKGYISHQGFSITCGECMGSEHLFAMTYKTAAMEAKQLGWKQKRGKGWICDECAASKEEV
jgi:hypothetical protein